MSDHTDVASAIQSIFERDGDVTASAVLRAAKSASSPLHRHFEWDNKKAGIEYRLVQARKLIRRVRITREEVIERLIHVPPVSRERGAEGTYLPASTIVRSESRYQRALSQALSQVASAQEALNELRQAADATQDSELARIGAAVAALRTAETALRMH